MWHNMGNVAQGLCLLANKYIRHNFSYRSVVEEMKVIWWTITRKVTFHIPMPSTKELAQDTTQGGGRS